MGIYPQRRTHDHRHLESGGEMWQEIETEPGITRRRAVRATPWALERTDCYCCSCSELSSDPACRNHGFAGRRPCETHNMPGQVWDHSGEMPDSVQIHRVNIGRVNFQ